MRVSEIRKHSLEPTHPISHHKVPEILSTSRVSLQKIAVVGNGQEAYNQTSALNQTSDVAQKNSLYFKHKMGAGVPKRGPVNISALEK